MGNGKKRKNTKICAFSHFKRNYDNEINKNVQKALRTLLIEIQRNNNISIREFSTRLLLNINSLSHRKHRLHRN